MKAALGPHAVGGSPPTQFVGGGRVQAEGQFPRVRQLSLFPILELVSESRGVLTVSGRNEAVGRKALLLDAYLAFLVSSTDLPRTRPMGFERSRL